jgi:uncharacterized protein
LNVLRAIISETNQLSSGPSPIRSDLQVLALLRKRKSASVAAAKEAEEQGRNDLKEKEEQQAKVIDEYAGSVKMMTPEEVKAVVTQTVDSLKEREGLNHGIIMKELLKPGGPLDGTPVEKRDLSDIVRDVIA